MASLAPEDESVSSSLNGDEVVISGISGIFPKSDSVNDFMDNLYNKIDMISKDSVKWKLNNPDLPKHMGKIKGTNKFDAQYFGVAYHLACALDPMGRKLMEHTYGAIFDSGTSLRSLRGEKIGVFVGSSYTDNSAVSMFNVNKQTTFIVNGGSKAMLANRISYWIDSKGPSYGLDYADASSSACLEIAYNSIKSGECDAAIVGGCNYGLHPNLTLNLRRAGLLCLDGKTKCFDKNADGYARADAINVIFLQRAKDAHRVYAEIYYAKGTYKVRPDAQFLPLRNAEDIEGFLKEVYSGLDLDPKQVEYVEAQGAAIAKADENELIAISNIFAKDTVIKVGSVKSNMGNSEPASGICSVTKLCLAYQKGKLPANLHYKVPQEHISAIKEKKVQVLSEEADFDRGFTAVNNFSSTGANFHIVLKGHYKKKNIDKYKCDIPYLIVASGRPESAVQKMFNILKGHPIDPEEIGLLHKAYEHDIPGHIGRGYLLLDTNENKEIVSLAESIEYYTGAKRPLWFVYSGMGSQWPTMAVDFMRIPTFAAAIQRCHKALEPKGIDLLKIITDPESTIVNNAVYAFVGIGAVQIGLTDVLKEMGIIPDSIIGHSLGELACGYCDDTLTAEEMVLCNYYRGEIVMENCQVEGLMAAVGLGYKTLVNQCHQDIDIACHNSSESSTISGPVEKVIEFVGDLRRRGVFAKEVKCGGVAYHSRYIAHNGPGLLKKLEKLITNPKKRSSKWLSTSVPEDKCHEHSSIFASAEYFTNNMMRSVYFEEMASNIPHNAIVVEIAPHGLLQAILKRSHTQCTHIPLASRGNPNGVQLLLQAIGKMYQAGVNVKLDVLYPKIEFPVSTETTLLSHYVEWEHSEDWPEASYLEKKETITASARNIVMSLYDDYYKFLEGHVREGVNVLPESAVLVLVWETLSMYMGVHYKNQSVSFKDIRFQGELTVSHDSPLRLFITINKGNNQFEVTHDDISIASGFVSGVKKVQFSQRIVRHEGVSFDDEIIILESEDVYKILTSRGYSYRGEFKTIQQYNLDHEQAFVEWNKNWITFLDSLIQYNTIAQDHNGISVVKCIRKLTISTVDQDLADIEEVNGVKCVQAQYNQNTGIIRCAGVEIANVIFTNKPVVQSQSDVLMSRSFYPHYAMDKVDLKTALQVNLQIIAENTVMNEIKVTQIVASNINISCVVKDMAKNIPNVHVQVTSVFNGNEDYTKLLAENTDAQKANVFIIENLLDGEKKLKYLRNISTDTFILAIETEVPKVQGLSELYFSVLSAMSDGKQILMLMRRQNLKDITHIRATSDIKFDWISHVHDMLNNITLKTTKRVVILSEKLTYCGALGLVNKIRQDGESKLSLLAATDYHSPAFHPNHIIYKEQLEKGLTINILRQGEWGGYYYKPVTTKITLRNFSLTRTTPGDFDSLTWIEAPTIRACNNLVQVSYAGISMMDVNRVITGYLEEENSFGMDFSGIDSDGERVMGLISGGAIRSTVEADPTLLWPVPEYWTLQDAATVPLAYAMAYYCLSVKAELLRGQTVLITGGAGSLGQALISLCLSLECTVFVTVSNEHKKKMLLNLFPQLDKNQIGLSRNESFLTMVRTKSGMKCCDFVINCLKGALRESAMKCIGQFGVFLDFNFYDMYENKNIGLFFLEGDTTYQAVNFSNIFRPENLNVRKAIQKRISEGIAKGTVKPLTRIEFQPAAISRAFRLLSARKHVGKVVIKMRSPDTMSKGLEVVPRVNYCSNGVYIVICDENDVGIELADRLIKRGVRNIILHMRSKDSGYLHTKFLFWQKYDVAIKISSDKIQTQEGCTKLVKEATRRGPVKGIFILQFPENDKNAQDYVQKFNKATVVINLDIVSRNLCIELSYFVLITTSSTHTSEEFAISVSENVCQTRTDLGAPALVVKAEGLAGFQKNSIQRTQSLSEVFNAMETGLKLKYNNILSYNVNETQNVQYLIKLAEILGVSSMESVKSEKLVSDFNLNECNLEELKILIKNVHQTNYSIDKIQRLTVSSLKNIGTEAPKAIRRDGLHAFYANIDDDEEHMASLHPIVPMITLVNNGVEDDLDPTKTYLLLIPGFEGRHEIFTLAAERLKMNAVAVHFANDLEEEGKSIPEIAANIRKFMKTKFETKSKFYLLGYSFGVNIALELAAMLEKEGRVGVVCCLDSSPGVLRTQMDAYLGCQNDSQLQNSVIKHMYELMTGQEIPLKVFEEAVSWSDKIDICLKLMPKLVNISNQYKRNLIESAYNKILMAKYYEPNFRLESEIVLIRGAPHPDLDSLPKDYNLSKYTKQPVKVFEIPSDHPSAPYDFRVSNIVNNLLDEKLLEEFSNKNRCEIYKFNTEDLFSQWFYTAAIQ